MDGKTSGKKCRLTSYLYMFSVFGEGDVGDEKALVLCEQLAASS